MASIDLPLSDAVRAMTINIRVTGQRRFAARAWLGTKIMALGAHVIGCDVDVSVADCDDGVVSFQPLGGPEKTFVGHRPQGS